MINPQKATELLALPYLTNNERVYLEDAENGRLGQWSGRLTLGMQGQMEYLLERSSAPLGCPNCEAPVPEIAARSKQNARDDDHRCPFCERSLRYCLSLIGGEQYWAVQPLRVEQEEHSHG